MKLVNIFLSVIISLLLLTVNVFVAKYFDFSNVIDVFFWFVFSAVSGWYYGSVVEKFYYWFDKKFVD